MDHDKTEMSVQYLVDAATAAQTTISEVVLKQQAEALEITCDELVAQMFDRLTVMDESVIEGSKPDVRSTSGLTGGDAWRMREHTHTGHGLLGSVVDGAITRALAVSELNAAMGRIVAAPTAGSCGVLPAAVLTMRNEYGCDEHACVMSLFTASAIGLVIEEQATLAGAEGGCQAEVGSAAAMASAAIVELAGGTPEQAGWAVSTTLQNMLGLVCDPVAGLVEVPCVKRNASGVVTAFVSAELSLAGCGNIIPADEAIAAMNRVGKRMPASLRETAEGGIAVTPTALSYAQRIIGLTQAANTHQESACASCGGCCW